MLLTDLWFNTLGWGLSKKWPVVAPKWPLFSV